MCVGIQKNSLKGSVCLSTQNTCLMINFFAKLDICLHNMAITDLSIFYDPKKSVTLPFLQVTGLTLLGFNSLQLEFIHSTNARYKVQTMLTLACSQVELIVRAFTLFSN